MVALKHFFARERRPPDPTLDSLSGYQNAVPAEQFMLLMMHELLTYLNQQGIVTILVLAQHGLVGPMQTTVDLTYLSDTMLVMRFFEWAERSGAPSPRSRSGPASTRIRFANTG